MRLVAMQVTKDSVREINFFFYIPLPALTQFGKRVHTAECTSETVTASLMKEEKLESV